MAGPCYSSQNGLYFPADRVLTDNGGNQATPADVLTELAMHYDEKIARRAPKNPRCPPLAFWQKLRIHFRGG